MTGQEIITLFETMMDDTSELSSSEELALANRIYKKICISPLECLKKMATGTTSTSVPYVTLPTDFLYIPDNSKYEESPKVVYVGTAKYTVISFADQREYSDQDGYAYVDLANSRLVFTKQPTIAQTYYFTYIYIPADITLFTSPVFPICHEAIAYGMCVDSYIIQQFDKAKSYASENQAKYDSAISDLKYYNSNLISL